MATQKPPMGRATTGSLFPELEAQLALEAELEAATVRALLRDFHRINHDFFRRALRPPVIVLGDAETRLGQWSPQDRTVEISRRLVREQPWGVVVEVLKHELAHQYAHEVLRARAETAHGDAFRRTCLLLGIDPAASGMPSAQPILDEESRVLSRIGKLLALAQSENEHEAGVAMREAQRLMLKHNLSQESAQGRDRSDEKTGDPGAARGYGFRHLGEPTGRLQAYQRILASILGEHFFVEPIWVTVHRPLTGTSGTVLEVCGTEPNLEMAVYVHDFLIATSERLWLSHKRSAGLRSDRDRRSFLVGVMRGFRDKLELQKEDHRKEGLVWLGDARLARYFDGRYPHRRKVRTASRAEPAAFAQGRKAGQTIVLNKPVAAGASPSPSAAGRLLPQKGRS